MAGETMVTGSGSKYHGRIKMTGQQFIEAPLRQNKGKASTGAKTGKDLRAGK